MAPIVKANMDEYAAEADIGNECYSDYGDDDNSPFHELYLQKYGMEFMMPILFEDGMDFIECELYYASLLSQSSGGAFRKQRSLQPRRVTSRELRSVEDEGPLPCIRKPHAHPASRKSGPPVRRCSFSGMPQIDEFPSLTRSNSTRRLGEEEPRVCFEEYVQVVTIYPAEEYPEEVRSQIWMSREEMSKCMRRAMMEDMKEHRDRARQQREEKEKSRSKRDQDDDDEELEDEEEYPEDDDGQYIDDHQHVEMETVEVGS